MAKRSNENNISVNDKEYSSSASSSQSSSSSSGSGYNSNHLNWSTIDVHKLEGAAAELNNIAKEPYTNSDIEESILYKN